MGTTVVVAAERLRTVYVYRSVSPTAYVSCGSIRLPPVTSIAPGSASGVLSTQEKLGFALVFVSHDLALVAQLAHRVTVMYAGQVVEQAPTSELLADPRHEYTRGLLGAVLSIESRAERLHQIPGTVPSPRDFPTGDRFAPRSSNPSTGSGPRPVLEPVADEPDHLVAVSQDEPLVSGGAR